MFPKKDKITPRPFLTGFSAVGMFLLEYQILDDLLIGG